ncbi:MAG: BTAD domain-containing putative transcriptional regulator [Desulfobulbaceae bacterium]|nr:BTAD domain-containing putative transcriptional regulator [Desulfobulbaceae bacterium]
MTNTHLTRLQIPANKYAPPRFAANKMLPRRRLIATHFAPSSDYQYIFFDAQAGQGKTTTAIQALSQAASSYVWYQVRQEDNDPLYFISALFEGIRRSVDGFTDCQSWGMISNGGATNLDLPNCINDMLHHLGETVSPRFFLVFDDLHLLEASEASLALLDHLLHTAPATLSFMLLSRRPVALKSKRVKFGGATLYLDNDDLALDAGEGVELLEIMLDSPLARQTALQINTFVGGWAMGLVLTARYLGSGRKAEGCLDNKFQHGLNAYFQEELLNTLPENLRRSLLQLSLLEDIPTDLAHEVTGRADIGTALETLQQQNYFVRSFDDENVYGFHDLFQQALQVLAAETLSREEIHSILSTAFAYSQRHGRTETAISYLIKMADYERLEQFLAQSGLRLVIQDRVATLGRIIGAIPTKIMQRSGWFLLFAGLLARQSAARGMELLNAANASFAESHDNIGELISLSCLISFHSEVSGMFAVGESLLPRANELFALLEDVLTPMVKALVAKNIAFGYILFEAEEKNAFRYVKIATQLAEQENLPNILGATMLITGYLYHVRGMRHQALAFAEKGYLLLSNRRIGGLAKAQLRTFLVNRLDTEGDHENYLQQRTALVDAIGSTVVNNTTIGSLLMLFDVHSAIGQARYEKAAQLLEQAFHSGAAQRQPFLECQFLMWRSFLEGMRGDNAEKATMQRALEVATLGAGPFTMIFVHIMRGLVSGLLDKNDAEEHIVQGMKMASEKQINYLLAYGHFAKAFCLLRHGQEQEAKQDIKECLRLMRENSYTHLRAWIPAVMGPVLQAAVRLKIETGYARLLARKKHLVAILDNGKTVPLLQISVLGNFVLKIGQKEIVGGQHFSQTHRQLLALLLSSPDLQIGLHKVILTLWPDSPPDKARAKIDTVVNRLRKTLADLIFPYPIKEYLVIQKGVLSLQNTWLDASEFTETLDQGMQHVTKEEWWQAGNCFSSALNLWQGCFTDDLFFDEQAAAFCEKLRLKLAQTGLLWSQHLIGRGEIGGALTVLEKVWSIEPSSEELTRALYRLYEQKGDLRKARALLNRFSEVMKSDETPEDELRASIEKIMATVK